MSEKVDPGTGEIVNSPTTPQTPLAMSDMFPPYVSPTLQQLDSRLRPNPSTVCERCPASVWFSGRDGVKAFCKVMHLVVWSSEEPHAMESCDGEVVANLERAAMMAQAIGAE